MKIELEGAPKEIADFVVALQSQPLTLVRKPYSDEFIVLNSNNVKLCTDSKLD